MGLTGMRTRPDSAQAQSGPVVRVDDVFKIFSTPGGETVALRGASIEIASGEFVALLGRSGSGKSTLLHLVAGLDVPSAGRIFLASEDIGYLDDEARAAIRQRTVGVVLQRDNLVPYLTAHENVTLPLRLAGIANPDRRASELLERVGLADRANYRVTKLSGGEQQRVSIALALAPSPRILLADEVTGELDSVTAGSILDLLCDLHTNDRMSLLVVTHDEAVAARAERVIVMRDGTVQPHE